MSRCTGLQSYLFTASGSPCAEYYNSTYTGFGTGAVKITSAHTPNYYECIKRHNLESITILTENGAKSQNGGGFQGMMHKHLWYIYRLTYILFSFSFSNPWLLGSLLGKEPNKMRLSLYQCSGDILEPMIKPQRYTIRELSEHLPFHMFYLDAMVRDKDDCKFRGQMCRSSCALSLFNSTLLATLVKLLSWLPLLIKLTITVSYSAMISFQNFFNFSTVKVP